MNATHTEAVARDPDAAFWRSQDLYYDKDSIREDLVGALADLLVERYEQEHAR